MRIFRIIIAISILAIAPLSAQAQKQNAPALPRVLIIGDSVYSNYTRELSKVFQNKAQITYSSWNPNEIPDSATTIKLLDRHLGRIDRNGKPVAEVEWPKWDLIHFNCGLGDLIHRFPKMKQFRVLPIHVGGIRNTPEDQYAKNLDALVKALRAKAPQAKLIWASTTPIRASQSNVFEKGSEIEYNKIAARVMAKHKVPTNDMYSYAKSVMNMDKPAGFGSDPFNFDKKPLHPPVVQTIEKELNLGQANAKEQN